MTRVTVRSKSQDSKTLTNPPQPKYLNLVNRRQIMTGGDRFLPTDA